MLSTYKTSIHFVRTHPLFCAAMVAVLTGLEMYQQYRGDVSVGAAVPMLFLFYALHRALMFGETRFDKSPAGPARLAHLLRFAGSAAAIVAATFAFAVLGVLIVEAATGWQGMNTPFIIIAFALAYFLSLCLLGSCLPAAAAGDRSGKMLRRSISQAPRVLAHILIGPLLFYAVVIATAFYAVPAIGPIESTLGFQSPKIVIVFIMNAFSFFAMLLAVAALCHAYRRVAPPEVLAAMGDHDPIVETFA